MNNLTIEEINVLMDGLSALEEKPQLVSSLQLMTLVSHAQCEEDAMERVNHFKELQEKSPNNSRALNEKLVLIKAKLIKIKDKKIIEEATNAR